jgi:hypothetical protein
MSQILSSLKLVTAKRQSVQNPTEFRRQKLSQKLQEQIQMAQRRTLRQYGTQRAQTIFSQPGWARMTYFYGTEYSGGL